MKIPGWLSTAQVGPPRNSPHYIYQRLPIMSRVRNVRALPIIRAENVWGSPVKQVRVRAGTFRRNRLEPPAKGDRIHAPADHCAAPPLLLER